MLNDAMCHATFQTKTLNINAGEIDKNAIASH